MELDDLKNIWKSSNVTFQHKDEAQISAMLHGKSKSIVNKLKRSVWLELIVTLLAGFALLIYALTLPSGGLKWTSIAILVVFVGYSIYYIKKLRLLKQYDSKDETLKASLEKLIHNLTNYLRFYKRSYTILYPVYFGLGLLFGGIETGIDSFVHTITETQTIIFLSVFAIIFYFCSTALVRWLLKKLYGNHLQKLSLLLSDIESTAQEPTHEN